MSKPAPHAGSPDAFEACFTRAQVEAALWKRIAGPNARKPSPTFKTRIKNMLEFDRGEPSDAMAFSDCPPEGRGEHGLFSAYDALCLGVGYDLLDLGFQRKSVVELLRSPLRELMRAPAGPRLNRALTASDAGRHGSSEGELILVIRRVASTGDQPIVCESKAAALKVVSVWLSDNLVLLNMTPNVAALPRLLLRAPRPRRGRG